MGPTHSAEGAILHETPVLPKFAMSSLSNAGILEKIGSSLGRTLGKNQLGDAL